MSSFVDGANAAHNVWQTRRADAARAFNSFMAQNPGATYQDYQSMANQLSGGNAYVRAGMAPQQVLQSMAQRNQQEEAYRNRLRQSQMLQQQAQFSSSLQSLATDMSLRYENDAEVEDAVVNFFGGDPTVREQVRSMAPNGFAPYRVRARAETMRANLPTVIEALQMDPDFDVSAMFPQFDKKTIDMLSKAAQTQLENEKKKVLDGEITTGINRGKNMVGAQHLPTASELNISQEAYERVLPSLQRWQGELSSSQEAKELAKQEGAQDKSRDMASAVGEKIRSDPGLTAKLTSGEMTIRDAISQAAADLQIQLPPQMVEVVANDMTDEVLNMRQSLLAQQASDRKAADQGRFAEQQQLTVANLTESAGESMSPVAAQVVRMLSAEFDLRSPAAQSVMMAGLNLETLENAGVDPNDYTQVARFIKESPEFQNSTRTLAETQATFGQSGVSEFMPTEVTEFGDWATQFSSSADSTIKEIDEALMNAFGENVEEGKLMPYSNTLKQQAEFLDAMADAQAETVAEVAESSQLWLAVDDRFDQQAAMRIAEQNAQTLRAQAMVYRRKAEAATQALIAAGKTAKEEAGLGKNIVGNERIPTTPPETFAMPTPSPMVKKGADAIKNLFSGGQVEGPDQVINSQRRDDMRQLQQELEMKAQRERYLQNPLMRQHILRQNGQPGNQDQ